MFLEFLENICCISIDFFPAVAPELRLRLEFSESSRQLESTPNLDSGIARFFIFMGVKSQLDSNSGNSQSHVKRVVLGLFILCFCLNWDGVFDKSGNGFVWGRGNLVYPLFLNLGVASLAQLPRSRESIGYRSKRYELQANSSSLRTFAGIELRRGGNHSSGSIYARAVDFICFSKVFVPQAACIAAAWVCEGYSASRRWSRGLKTSSATRQFSFLKPLHTSSLGLWGMMFCG